MKRSFNNLSVKNSFIKNSPIIPFIKGDENRFVKGDENKLLSQQGGFSPLGFKRKKQANFSSLGFTLVELIVVITILAILATVGFIGYSNYIVGSRDSARVQALKTRDSARVQALKTRDSARVQALKNISEALTTYSTNKDLPLPEEKVEIVVGTGSNEKVIAYQGKLGKNIVEQVNYTGEGVDPKDGSYYSYYLTKNRQHFQLMAFLEDSSNLQNKFSAGIITKTYAITDYTDRYPTVWGDKLGILTDENNTPIQEIPAIKTAQKLNISTTTDTYVAHIKDNEEPIEGTGSKLTVLKGLANSGGKILKSCKALLDDKAGLKGKDGVYLINPDGKKAFPVYCDMTTDGGGWTLVLKADGSKTTFDYTSSYWITDNILNEGNFDHNKVEFKSNLFNSMHLDEILLELVTGSETRTISISKASNSFKEIFNNGYQPLNISKTTWMNLVPGSSLQPNCNESGFNTSHGTQVRIGISSNNENNCDSNDSVLGIGLESYGSYNSSVGNNCGSTLCSSGNKEINSFGYLYIK